MRTFSLILSSILALGTLSMAAPAGAQGIGVSITIAPPALPIYEQPPVPGPGYLWTPGYWAYGDAGYYWVPGTWVQAPQPNLLWTPGYWGWLGVGFVWHEGYWGTEVGFYGGLNYGFGYGGVGFEGGHWDHGAYFYNRSVTNVSNTTVTNVYNKTVVNNVTVNHVSYNGGTGGVAARPSEREVAVARQPHVAPTPVQVEHQHVASTNKELLASANGGRPPVAATAKPGQLNGSGAAAQRSTGAPARPANEEPARSTARGNSPATESREAPRTPAESHPQAKSRPPAEAHPQAQSHPAAPRNEPPTAVEHPAAPRKEAPPLIEHPVPRSTPENAQPARENTNGLKPPAAARGVPKPSGPREDEHARDRHPGGSEGR